MLDENYGVAADVWSVTSYKELRRDALDCERWNMLHPGEAAARSVRDQRSCTDATGPFVAASDYMKVCAGQSIAQWVPGQMISLGTDGFGRSDSRARLRDFFEVDAKHIVVGDALARSLARNKSATMFWTKPFAISASIQRNSTRPTAKENANDAWRRNSNCRNWARTSIQGDLVRLMVGPGTSVTEGQPVMELETDKAVIEVPSSVSGTIGEIRVKEGDKLRVGQVIFTVENGTGAPVERKGREKRRPSQHSGRKRAEACNGRASTAKKCPASRRPRLLPGLRIQNAGTRREHRFRRPGSADDRARARESPKDSR